MQKNALLASDMDGTVIPLEEGKERDEEIRRFRQLMEENSQVALAYVTGRHLELGMAGVEKHRLPFPDIFVCDVGTTIYFHNHKNWQHDEGYREELTKSWSRHTGPDIASFLEGINGLETQEAEKQGEFNLGRGHDAEAVLQSIRNRLTGRGLTANIIYSVDSLKDIGLVDVLPPVAAKDYALAYLQKKLGLEQERVVYAGDSGNDLLAFVSGFNAIIVNNTAEPVKEEVRRQARVKGIEAQIFFASARFVQGVMEGCFHFNLFGKAG